MATTTNESAPTLAEILEFSEAVATLRRFQDRHGATVDLVMKPPGSDWHLNPVAFLAETARNLLRQNWPGQPVLHGDRIVWYSPTHSAYLSSPAIRAEAYRGAGPAETPRTIAESFARPEALGTKAEPLGPFRFEDPDKGD